MANDFPQAKNPIKATRTTFEILNTLRDLEGAGITEISKELDLPKSSIHNYLSTLEEDEYVIKKDSKYDVGMRFLELGAYARNRSPIYEVARPEIRKLAKETGERANLLVEEHGRGVYLAKESGENAVKFDAYTGYRVHLHNTALGKAILSHLSRDRVEQILDRHGMPQATEKSVSSREELFDELDRIAERGAAFDREERLTGVRCVAVPVLSHTDGKRVEGAISVSGPKSRMQGERFEEEILELLENAANVIGLNITHS